MNFYNLPELVKTYDYKNQPFRSDDFRTLPRPIASIAYIVKGNVKYFTESKTFDLSQGDILFVPVGGTYISYWDDQMS